MLDTRPTVTMQVSSTCVCKCRDDNIQFRAEYGFNVAGRILIQMTSPEPAASKEAERLPFHLLYGAERRLCLETKWTTTLSLDDWGIIMSKYFTAAIRCTKHSENIRWNNQSPNCINTEPKHAFRKQ